MIVEEGCAHAGTHCGAILLERSEEGFIAKVILAEKVMYECVVIAPDAFSALAFAGPELAEIAEENDPIITEE